MRNIIDFNDGWLFEGRDRVRLPHNAVDLPFNYFDEKVYQRPFTYEKTFTFDPAWTGREVTVHFEGAMANAEVRLDGQLIARHAVASLRTESDAIGPCATCGKPALYSPARSVPASE